MRTTLAAAAAATVIVLLAGCGSGGEAGPAADRPAGTALAVTETEFAIDPATSRIERAGTVRLAVANRGKAPHALAVETPKGVVATDTLAPGASARLRVDLDAGTYTWYCPVGNHRARGMEGRITVAGGKARSGAAKKQPRGSFGY